MKIAFDAQLLFEDQKTGIGWNAKMMIDHLIQDPDLECELNCFLMRDRMRAKKVLEEYHKKGCRINQSKWMPARIYNHLERLIPIPYQWIFGKNAELTQFFNYTIPFGVSGKKITIVHDMAFQAYPETVAERTRRWLHNNLKTYCTRADVILTVSEFSKREIELYLRVPSDKIEVVYNGVDMDKYHADYSQQQIEQIKEVYQISGDYLLYLGTLEPRKNIESLITAYGLLKQEKKQIPKLVLVGKKGWMYDLIFELVKELGLVNDVIFTGYVAEEDVPILMCGASIFVFPSLYEGFGIPPLEAMACGTPVITSNVSSLPEVVGNAGIMVPPKDVTLLKDKIWELLTDQALRNQLRQAGFEQAKKFTWQRSADKLVEIYKKF